MPRRASIVWKYYNKYKKGKYVHGDCKFCKKSFVANPKRMQSHLANCKRAPNEIKKAYEKLSEAENNQLQSTHSDPDEAKWKSPPSEISSTLTTGNRSTLTSFFDNITDAENIILRQMLARAIYCTGTPLSLVEDPLFKKFMARLRPSFNLPSRYQISTKMLDQEYESTRKKISEKIKKAEVLTILTDSWTDVNGISLLNVIICTPTPVFYRAINSGTQSHTGEYICKMLSEVIEEVGASKVEAFVSDNARNMKTAWEKLRGIYPHLITYGCMAHGLNLLLKDVMNISTISKHAAVAKDIIKIFKNKHLPKEVLKEIQFVQMGKEIALITATETRWGSVVLSILSLLHSKDSLQQAVLDKRLKNVIDLRIRKQILDEDFWGFLNDICSVTKPILDIITELESDKPVLSKVCPFLKKLEIIFYDDAQVSFLKTSEVKTFREVFSNRKKFFFHPVQLASYLLDPKEQGAELSEEESSKALDFILEFATSHAFDSEQILVEIAEYKAKTGSWENANIWRAAEKSEPLTWWKGFFSKKELTKVAIRVLSLPATSASCERNFKTFSLVKTKKRNRLTIDRTNKLVYIKHNLRTLLKENENFDFQIIATDNDNADLNEENEIHQSTTENSDNDTENEEVSDDTDMDISVYDEDEDEDYNMAVKETEERNAEDEDIEITESSDNEVNSENCESQIEEYNFHKEFVNKSEMGNVEIVENENIVAGSSSSQLPKILIFKNLLLEK